MLLERKRGKNDCFFVNYPIYFRQQTLKGDLNMFLCERKQTRILRSPYYYFVESVSGR